jgi:hypothetical protein
MNKNEVAKKKIEIAKERICDVNNFLLVVEVE